MRSKKLAAIALVVFARGSLSVASAQNYHRGGTWWRSSSIPAGTTMNVRLDSGISTESSQSGDSWTGTVSQSVYANGNVVIPAGSPVEGVVTNAMQGTHETRPEIDLSVRQVTVNGQTRSLRADTPPIVAGSNRAK